MEKSEGRGFGRTILLVFLTLLVIGLAGVVLYLLSDINHRQYRVRTQQGTLVIERGRMFPVGFKRFEPEAEDLGAAYAPIPIPPGESFGQSETYDDRSDLDRALFSLLAGWGRENLDSPEPGDLELAATYIRRAELLPGLSEEQRIELRTLRADLAFRTGRRILDGVVDQLNRALGAFQTAKQLGTSRPQDLEKWIADVRRRIRDYKESYEQPPALQRQPPQPEAVPPRPELAPTPKQEEQPPKWRL